MVFMVHHEGSIRPFERGDIVRLRAKRNVQKVSAIESVSEAHHSVQDDSIEGDARITTYGDSGAQQLRQKREEVLRAEQIMNGSVKTLSPKDSILDAWKMFRNERFRHIPVLSVDGALVGVISDRDVLHLGPEVLSSSAPRREVASVMKTTVLSASPSAAIHDLARVMFEERVGCIPIVSEDEKLLGIVTRSDILRSVMNRAPLHLWS